MKKVVTLILGGGEGKRLHPLTLTKCKPALTVGGKFRLIDFPLASAIHSGSQKIFVLTQFLSTSLHAHLQKTYHQIEILSCEQKPTTKEWYQGTADAIRHHLEYLSEKSFDYFLILSGDQLYQMDFNKLLEHAKIKDADCVIATRSVNKLLAERMGILKIDTQGQIIDFQEKQKQTGEGPFLGSLGIYLFRRQTLIDTLKRHPGHDFGHDLLPHLIHEAKCFSYLFEGYWEDIGTVESFYEANLRFLDPSPPLDLHASHLFTPPTSLPAPKITQTHISQSMLAEGSHIEAKRISRSLIGPRTHLGAETQIDASYILGSTRIGNDCLIKKGIIDENVTLGEHVSLLNTQGLTHYDSPYALIRDGIIIVPRGTHIPSNYTL